jgi:tetratricopeptide (TPR) repeat protein
MAERNERLDEALELIQRALEQDFWEGAYQDSLGWVYFQMGLFAEAREPMERAAREYPKDPIILEHLGDLYLRLDEQALAVSAWMRALAARPEKPEELRSKLAGQGAAIDASETRQTEKTSEPESPM